MPDSTNGSKNKGDLPPNKQNVAKVSIVAISTLIAMKVVASILTGSVGIRADAVHSIMDLSGAVIGFIAIRYAQKPPDKEHAYGHSKAENIAGVIIAGIIFIAAGTIIYEAIKRLIAGTAVEMVTIGIFVTAFAIVINTAISWYALRVARSSDSVALEATARDMLADVFSSCAVLIGLILVSVTGLTILDPIVALLVAVLIIRAAYITMKKSFKGLIDTSLPQEEQDIIIQCITEHSEQVVDFHKLRTRKAGAERFIDFHLIMPRTIDIQEAHLFCDHLQEDIQTALHQSNVTIHIEPCDNNCQACSATCNLK
jgi:cation diffusion facilitator family transporter